MKKLVYFLSFLVLPNLVSATNYYWVGGTGAWSDYANHWATTSGGNVFHTIVPTPADNVFFDSNSFVSLFDTVYVTAPIVYCNSMEWTGLSDSAAITGSGIIQVFGSLALHPQIIFDCYLVFRTSGYSTIQARGVRLTNGIEFNGTGSWGLLSELDLRGFMQVTGQLILRRGNLYTNGYPLTLGYLTANDTLTPVTLDLDTSHVWISGDFSMVNGFNKQLDADSATLNIFDWLFASGYVFDEVFADNFVTDSCTFYNSEGRVTGNANHFHHLTSTRIEGNDNTVNVLTMPGANGTLNGNNQFDTLYITNTGQLLHLQSGSITTVNSQLEIQSSPGTPTQITSSGPATISMPAGTVCADYIYLENIVASGGATFYAGSHSFDLGGNSGWNWTSCSPQISNVWPGDCNYDLVTNNLDLLNIGLAYGDTGFVRPAASLNYTPQPCMDWIYQFGNGVNEKNADCDGNGVVTFQDTTAISLNYVLPHPARPVNQSSATSSGVVVTIDMPSTPVAAGTVISAPVWISNILPNWSYLYGAAFTILYDSSFIVPGTMYMDYSSSQLATAGAILNIDKDFPSIGQHDIAVTRFNHTDISIFYSILLGTLHFTITPTAIGTLQFDLANIKLITHTGAEIPVLEIPDSMIVGVQEISRLLDFSMYPVPAKNELYLFCGELKGRKVEVTVSDATCRTLWNEVLYTNAGMFSARIPVNGFASGVYFVSIRTEKEQGMRKFIKE